MGPNLNRETARALVDAGYMPLKRYVELYGDGEAIENRSLRFETARPRVSAHDRPPQRRKPKIHKAA